MVPPTDSPAKTPGGADADRTSSLKIFSGARWSAKTINWACGACGACACKGLPWLQAQPYRTKERTNGLPELEPVSMYMLLHSNPINLLFVSVPSADLTIKEELVLGKRGSLQASASGRHILLEREILLRCLARAASFGGTGVEDLCLDNCR